MKVVQVEMPDQMAVELGTLVKEGWFDDEPEILRLALMEFITSLRFALLEQFQREDIAWALQQKRGKIGEL